jgi:hypothetical protein
LLTRPAQLEKLSTESAGGVPKGNLPSGRDGSTWAYRSLGIDIGADEFRMVFPTLDADLGRAFIRGDANNDGSVDIADQVFLLAHLFQGGPAPVCLDAADANDDESVDVSDAVFLQLYLFGNLPLPGLFTLPEPFPHCGFDVYRVGGSLHCGAPTFCSQ